MRVTYKGGARFDVTGRRHTIVTDQPKEDGGADAGMSPVELFAGSLASCVGYFVGRYCARHQIPCDGFSIDTDWSYAEHPHRVGAIDMRIHLPAAVSPEQQERLLAVAHGCTVHQSLAVPPLVGITVAAPSETAAR
jgi:uncharacterized OsmC-like protein